MYALLVTLATLLSAPGSDLSTELLEEYRLELMLRLLPALIVPGTGVLFMMSNANREG